MMSSAYNPVVVLHGIDASNDTLSHMKSLIEANVDGIYVRNLEIGNGKADTFLFTMNEQVETMCKELAADEHLGDEINIVAVSQGALVSRGGLSLVLWIIPVFKFYFQVISKDAIHRK